MELVIYMAYTRHIYESSKIKKHKIKDLCEIHDVLQWEILFIITADKDIQSWDKFTKARRN